MQVVLELMSQTCYYDLLTGPGQPYVDVGTYLCTMHVLIHLCTFSLILLYITSI